MRRYQTIFWWTPRWFFGNQVDGWQEVYFWIGGIICGCFGEISLGYFLERSPSYHTVDEISYQRDIFREREREWRELPRSLEYIEMRGPTYFWFARVPSDSNIADGPSRDDFSGLELFEATMPVCTFAQSLVQW